MKIFLEAANLGTNLLGSRKSPVPTLPPLPIAFTGEIDITPLFLYDQVVIDQSSIDYITSEKILSDRSRALLEMVLAEKLVLPMDYSAKLRSHEDELRIASSEFYDVMREDIATNTVGSAYFQSKTEWLDFARANEEHDKTSIWFKDTEESVKANLKRIIDGKLIPRDYLYLRENLSDVICNRKLADELDMPMYGWSNWSHYYNQLDADHLRLSRDAHVRNKEVLQAIWTLAFPKLSLDKLEPDAFLALREENHVKDIRSFVETTNLAPETLTQEWFEDISKTLKYRDWGTTSFGVLGVSASVALAFAGPIAPLVAAGTSVGFFAGERVLHRMSSQKRRLVRTVERARSVVGEHAQ